jgi:hypothetical protein
MKKINGFIFNIKKEVYALLFFLFSFVSCTSYAQQVEHLICPKAEVIRTFLNSIQKAGDMETVRYHFVKLFASQTKNQTSTSIQSACWSLRTDEDFDDPLRAVSLYLNDEALEQNKSGLVPKVKDQFCLAATSVFGTFEWHHQASFIMKTGLTTALYDFPSSMFKKINIHELKGCLIFIELSTIQTR